MKAQLPPRLTQTKTGVYGYRRKIKKPHQRMFDGKTEIFKSFKTKTRSISIQFYKVSMLHIFIVIQLDKIHILSMVFVFAFSLTFLIHTAAPTVYP